MQANSKSYSGTLDSFEIKLLLRALVYDQRQDLDEILSGTGVDHSILTKARYPLRPEQEMELYVRLANLNQDTLLSIKIGLQLKIESFGLIGYAMSISETLYDALKVGANFCQLIGWSSTLKMIQENHNGRDLVGWEMTPSSLGENAIKLETESTFIAFHSIFQSILGYPPQFARMTFAHERPLYEQPHFTDVLGPGLSFSAGHYRLLFTPEILSHDLPFASREQSKIIRELCREKVSKLLKSINTQTAVSDYVTLHLENNPSITSVAKSIGFSERTLRRRLKSENTNFRNIMDIVREREAKRYLLATNMTIESIGHLLGYHEARTFRAAFKKWTGIPPGKWREKT